MLSAVVKASWLIVTLLLGVSCVACESAPTELLVSLQTDLLPGREFTGVRVSLGGPDGAEMQVEAAASLGEPYGEGVRVADFAGLNEGLYRVVVAVLDDAGHVVEERPVRLQVSGTAGINVVISRNCRGVSCPGADAATAIACLGGTCVQEQCLEGGPECGEPQCIADSDCAPSGIPCTAAICSSGACLSVPDSGNCDPGDVCDADLGCVAVESLDLAASFGAPELVAELQDAAPDDDPSLTGDMLEIYWNSSRTVERQIWRATRTSIDDPFTNLEPVDELNTAGNQSNPEVSGDGLLMHLTVVDDIYVTTRPDRSSPWATPVLLPELQSETLDAGGTLTDDRLRLFFFRPPQMLEATRASEAEPWSPSAIMVGRVNPVIEPFVDGSGLVVYYAERTVGSIFDLRVSKRANRDALFGASVRLGGLSTEEDETDPWVSPDGRVIYFSRGESDDGDIYRAFR